MVAFSSILAPDTIFAFLLSCSGGVILVVYSMIVAAYIKAREAAQKAGEADGYNLPFFPYCNYVALIAVVLVFVAMLLNPAERMTAVASIGTSVVCYGLASFRTGRRASSAAL
ncbi:hypothetical protein AtDm6_2486 [Acetobacter tropicalis]|uniref:Amino acid permease/ SLC12A domain-containing protein n=1 Tax=Acetobacter tropicalis TaxID=104102 RepID=A0A094YKA2_9PROT|nr:hypothetical protein AtDm6_2486 [Acetobacter tropicalis]